MLTCGELYLEGMTKHCRRTDCVGLVSGPDNEMVRVWAAGFISGQAEKVYNGVCGAAMFRPSSDRFKMVVEVAKAVANLYGLKLVVGNSEVWICQADVESSVNEMMKLPENSERYHQVRAAMCGIPASNVDTKYHERPGFGKRCD